MACNRHINAHKLLRKRYKFPMAINAEKPPAFRQLFCIINIRDRLAARPGAYSNPNRKGNTNTTNALQMVYSGRNTPSDAPTADKPLRLLSTENSFNPT